MSLNFSSSQLAGISLAGLVCKLISIYLDFSCELGTGIGNPNEILDDCDNPKIVIIQIYVMSHTALKLGSFVTIKVKMLWEAPLDSFIFHQVFSSGGGLQPVRNCQGKLIQEGSINPTVGYKGDVRLSLSTASVTFNIPPILSCLP